MVSVAKLVEGYRAGRRSPVEVVEEALAGIEEWRDLNAFWSTLADQAQQEARQAEVRWRAGRGAPLLGVPVAVKDLFDTAGTVTTYGSPIFGGHVPTADAAAVRALRRAGAIVVGKTATHEFAYGVTTANRHFGPTRNPYDRTRIVGGSSGGSAAAVGAGIVPIALGSDTSCSVRLPPAFTGCVGLRPTQDTLSGAGAMPLAPSLDVLGPIGATVADVATMAEVLWRGCPGSASAPKPLRRSTRPLKIGLIMQGWPAAPTDDVAGAMDAAIRGLEALGHEVTEIAIPGFTTANDYYGAVMAPEALGVHRRRGLWPEHKAEYGADVVARLTFAEQVSITEHVDAVARRNDLRIAVACAFRDMDVLLTPASAIAAPPIDGCDNPIYNGSPTPLRDLVLPFHVPQSLCGVPAIVLPVGFDRDGLPTSVQLTAAVGMDRFLLSVAADLEPHLAFTPNARGNR